MRLPDGIRGAADVPDERVGGAAEVAVQAPAAVLQAALEDYPRRLFAGAILLFDASAPFRHDGTLQLARGPRHRVAIYRGQLAHHYGDSLCQRARVSGAASCFTSIKHYNFNSLHAPD